jgi:WhiB family redox-sensing transcriptional regulator
MRNAAPVFIEPTSTDWWQHAECVHYSGRVDFFPSRGESAREAKEVCGRCPVRNDCLEFAMRFEPLCGVWGGMSERERRQLRRERATRNRMA